MPKIPSVHRLEYILEKLPDADQQTAEARKQFWTEVSRYWDGFIDKVELDERGRVVHTPKISEG